MASMKRRIVAILLTVVMLLQLAPTGLADTLYSNEVRGTQTYTVTFTDKDGKTLVTQLVASGASPIQPDIPDVEGYEFAGWQVNGGEVKSIGDIDITGDTTLKATYNEIKTYTCTVYYRYNDGTDAFESDVYEYRAGSKVELTIPVKTLENFTTDAGSITFSIDAINENRWQVVHYTGKEFGYTVNHLLQNADDNGYTLAQSETKTGEYGRRTTAEAKSYPGFTALPIEQQTIAGEGSDTVTVEVKYDRNTHSVSFDNNGGVNSGEKLDGIYRYGKTINLPTSNEMSRLGYTFAGWKINGEGDTLTGTVTVPGEDIILVAQWDENRTASYTVVYWLQSLTDDKNAVDANKTYQFVKKQSVSNATVGSTIQGVNVAVSNVGISSTFVTLNTTNSDVNTNGTSNLTVAADGSTVVNVKFDRNTITYKFYGSYSDYWYNRDPQYTKTGLYGQTWTQAKETAGWPDGLWIDTGALGGGNGGWTYLDGFKSSNLKDVEVVFYLKDDKGETEVIQYIEELDGSWQKANTYSGDFNSFTLTEKFQPGFSLHQFRKDNARNWQDASNNSAVYNISNKLEIRNKRNSFTLSFANCIGVNNQTLKYEEPLSNYQVVDDPTGTIGKPAGVEADYVFAGWYLDSAFQTPVNWKTAIMPASNLQVFAKWVAPTYKVIFHYNDLDASSTRDEYTTKDVTKYNTLENDMPTDPAGLTKDYEFVAWYQDAKCTLGFMPGSAITGNTDVYAKWKKVGEVDYNIEYKDEDGNTLNPKGEPTSGTGTAGAELTLDAPAIPGYIAQKSKITFTVSEGYTVTFIYRKIDSWTLTVEYLEADTEKVLSEKETSIITEKEKVVRFKEIPGYNVDKIVQTADKEHNTLTFYYTPITLKNYKIEYYLEQANGKYELEKTVTKEGKLGDTARITDDDKIRIDDYELYAAHPDTVTSVTILANGEATLKLYYKRNVFTVTYNKGAHGNLEGEDNSGNVVHNNVPYGDDTPAAPAVTPEKGWYFTGWDPAVAKTVTGDITYTAQYAATGKITIALESKTVTYNGQKQSLDINNTKIDGAPTGFTLESIGATIEGGEGTNVVGSPYEGHLISKQGDQLPTQWADSEGKVYDITYKPGTLTIEPKKVTITAGSASRAYNGNALTDSSYEATALEQGDTHEFKVEMTADSTITEVGTKANVIATVDGAAVETGKEQQIGNYLVTTEEGLLEITANEKKLEIKSADKSWVYDGSEHKYDVYTVKYDGETLSATNDAGNEFKLPTGDILTITGTASVKNVADTKNENNTYTYTLTNKDQYSNVSEEYGTLTIEPKKVTITAGSASRAYNGNALTDSSYEATALEQGDTHEFKVEMTADSTITEVGTKANVIATVDGAAVETGKEQQIGNYLVTTEEGLLEITANTDEVVVTITGHKKTVTYNGAEHEVTGYDVSISNDLYKEEYFSFSGNDEAKGINAKTYEMGLKVADFTNNNKNFDKVKFVVEDGSLTIEPRSLEIKVNEKSYTYDGTEHTVAGDDGEEYTVELATESSDSGLLNGHKANLNVVYDDGTTKTESRKYVGEYTADSERDENGEAVVTITIEDSGEDVTANYAIVVIPGELEIQKAEALIKIVGPDSERVYNGQKQVVRTTDITTDPDYAPSEEEPDKIKILVTGLIPGDYIEIGTVIHVAEGTYVGKYEGNFEWDGLHKDEEIPTVLNDGVDVTQNYKFEHTKGWLTIIPEQDHPTQPVKEIDESKHETGTKYGLGDRIYFTITVRNITLEELKDVQVYDPTAVIVPGDDYKVIDEHNALIESMAASVEGKEPTTVVITAYHVVTEEDIMKAATDDSYKYENVATIKVGDKTIDAKAGTNDIEDPDLTLEIVKKLVNQPAAGNAFKLGETAKFEITVTNLGNVTQRNIPVTEALAGAVFTEGPGYTLNDDKTVATIAVLTPKATDEQNASIILYAQYTIKEEDLGNKNLKNIVTAPNGKPGEVPIPVDEAKSMAGQKIWNDLDNLYDTRTESVTVNLMRKAGQNGAAEQYKTATVDQSTGWRYGFDHLPAHDMQNNEFFYWVEEAPITGYEPTYEVKDDSHCDIVNNLQTYTLTIHYWQHKLGDTKMEQAFPDYVATLYYKQPYDVESPEREGIILDDMSQARISGTMPAHDLVIDVYYHRIAYRLTIHYIYQDGTMAHEDYTWTYWFNSTYNVPSPIIPGFTPSIDVIAGRMPSHGLEFTVVYVGDGEIVVPDEDTSLGFKSYLNAGECFE